MAHLHHGRGAAVRTEELEELALDTRIEDALASGASGWEADVDKLEEAAAAAAERRSVHRNAWLHQLENEWDTEAMRLELEWSALRSELQTLSLLCGQVCRLPILRHRERPLPPEELAVPTVPDACAQEAALVDEREGFEMDAAEREAEAMWTEHVEQAREQARQDVHAARAR